MPDSARLRDPEDLRAARALAHSARTDPHAAAVEGHSGAVARRTLFGEGEASRLLPLSVAVSGEEDRRACSLVRTGRPDEHGSARCGQACAESVAAAAIG